MDENRLAEIREWTRIARPGPWHRAYANVAPGVRGIGIFADTGDPIASVYSPFRDIEDAHAGLISAIPDLLEEIERLRDALLLELVP